jgi:NAD(P)-dependent dehydrogenase (short-subunit alcohol dehydrogenase family)
MAVGQRFVGQTVLVTGAASGLGAETAAQFAAEGARLVLVDIDASALGAQAAWLRDRGADVESVAGDASRDDVARSAVEAARRTFGAVDILFNNAGIDPLSARRVTLTTEEQWDRVMAVNVRSAFLFSRAVLPAMVERGRGVIVNTASIAGLKPGPDETVYNVSKAALVQLTRSMALDYAADGIRVNCICPGFLEAVMTDRRQDLSPDELDGRSARASALVPLGREGRYAEIARSVLFLADPKEASYITGASLVVDGGILLA